jgi:hypothetical protein
MTWNTIWNLNKHIMCPIHGIFNLEPDFDYKSGQQYSPPFQRL